MNQIGAIQGMLQSLLVRAESQGLVRTNASTQTRSPQPDKDAKTENVTNVTEPKMEAIAVEPVPVPAEVPPDGQQGIMEGFERSLQLKFKHFIEKSLLDYAKTTESRFFEIHTKYRRLKEKYEETSRESQTLKAVVESYKVQLEHANTRIAQLSQRCQIEHRPA